MTLAPITSWRIHIGAHKTATTHLQETLAAMRPELVARGVDFIPLADLRRAGFAKAFGRRRAWNRVPPLRGPMVRRMAGRYLDPLRAGPATLVLSEEKLIGGSQLIFADPIYPGMHRIIRLLATLGRQADLTLFLAIRSFDTQLPSAYVQELRYMPPIGGGFDNIKRRVLRHPPSWFELVRRIRAAAPGVPLRVWRQEDYRGNTAAILGALTGIGALPALPEVADPAWTKSPGLEAIRAVEALPPMPETERRERARAIFAAAGGEGGRFRPFEPEERAMLQAGYAADLERIAALDPKILLRF
jgi:hypothetical protein